MAWTQRDGPARACRHLLSLDIAGTEPRPTATTQAQARLWSTRGHQGSQETRRAQLRRHRAISTPHHTYDTSHTPNIMYNTPHGVRGTQPEESSLLPKRLPFSGSGRTPPHCPLAQAPLHIFTTTQGCSRSRTRVHSRPAQESRHSCQGQVQLQRRPPRPPGAGGAGVFSPVTWS